ncbi:MAG: hypothetical protein O7D86_07225 [Proteobacteria bacterium]|nr:hypothetical protein [Pseudomonadota bacterium]
MTRDILRTSVSAEQLTAHDTVRTYKRLSQVERAFRSFNMPCLNKLFTV